MTLVLNITTCLSLKYYIGPERNKMNVLVHAFSCDGSVKGNIFILLDRIVTLKHSSTLSEQANKSLGMSLILLSAWHILETQNVGCSYKPPTLLFDIDSL